MYVIYNYVDATKDWNVSVAIVGLSVFV